MIVRTVGMITDPFEANNIIIRKDADMIAMARAFLSNPRWVWDAAKVLNHDIEVPPQYARRISLILFFFVSKNVNKRF